MHCLKILSSFKVNMKFRKLRFIVYVINSNDLILKNSLMRLILLAQKELLQFLNHANKMEMI